MSKTLNYPEPPHSIINVYDLNTSTITNITSKAQIKKVWYRTPQRARIIIRTLLTITREGITVGLLLLRGHSLLLIAALWGPVRTTTMTATVPAATVR